MEFYEQTEFTCTSRQHITLWAKSNQSSDGEPNDHAMQNAGLDHGSGHFFNLANT
jgi:hypothetical protein